VSLQDRLLVWTFTANKSIARAIPYSFNELADDVDAFRNAITSPHNADRSDLALKIFDRLLASPLRDLSSSIHRLLIAADGAIGDLPIATLVDPRTNRFLGERYDVAFIPSLGALSSDHDTRRADNVLAVGFNGPAGHGLAVLAGAEREAAAIGSIYRQATVLTGEAATPSAVRSATANRGVLHIAAHARANRLLPWKSQLDLATSDGSDGFLDFEEVSTWNLRSCALVVLSACETATGARVGGQGVISLAFPFLSAGAQVVVGTLWQIDDRGAERFMRLFHRYVSRNELPSHAMSLAQRDAIASSDPILRSPAVWSAYIAYTRTLTAPSQIPPPGQSIPGDVR